MYLFSSHFLFVKCFLRKKKRINNRLMHVLRYIWKHLSNHDVFEAHSVPFHAYWGFVIVDARQKNFKEARLRRRTKRRRLCMNVPASSSCKHAPIVLSEDDRIGYYPQTFRFTSSSCKRGLRKLALNIGKTEIFRDENCSAFSTSTDVDQVHRSAQPFLFLASFAILSSRFYFFLKWA